VKCESTYGVIKLCEFQGRWMDDESVLEGGGFDAEKRNLGDWVVERG
jgi:hypothetical protein